MHKELIKMADKFDAEGKFHLSDRIDQLLTTAARQKAPLKSLDDDVKKDLLKFLNKVQSNIQDSMDSLEEFFRRLRYFDIGDMVKKLELDKSLKELSRVKGCMDNAHKAVYVMSYGKSPSKGDLEQMAKDVEQDDKSSSLDFFKSQYDVDGSAELSEPAESAEPTEEEYETFMKELGTTEESFEESDEVE